jgi:hypothetical protein
MELPKAVIGLVGTIFDDESVEVTDWDMDRIYVDKNDQEYTIRMWDVTNTNVRWELFKIVPDDTGSHGESVKEGNYKYA